MKTSRQKDLLTAAAELLDQAGVSAVTLREVAAAVGISHNAPYRHFSSKQDLLEALIAREIINLCEEAQRREKTPSVHVLSMVFVEWALSYPQRFRLVLQQWPHGDREDLHQAMRAWDCMYDAGVVAAQQQFLLPKGEMKALSYLVRSVTQGAIQLYLSAGEAEAPAPAQIINDLFHHLENAAASEK